MKKHNLNEQINIRRWKKLAGIINENVSPTYEEDDVEIKELETVLGKEKVMGLSSIDKGLANDVIGGGIDDKDKSDDMVAGKKVSVAVGNLRPAQTEIIKDKAFGMAVNFLNKGNYENADLGAIISNDSNPYIMDGHHRWAATSLIDPKAKVQATQIELPGGPLVSALNLVTVGKLGITTGNKGEGNVAEFTGGGMEKVIDTALEKGTPGKFGVPAEEVKAALEKMPGSGGDAQKGKAMMMKNADKLPKQKMPGAPARVEMPVIDGKKVSIVQKMLEKGMIDIAKPYSPDVKKSMGTEEEVEVEEKETEEVKENLKRYYREFFK